MADFFRCDTCDKYVKVVEPGKGELHCCGNPMTLVQKFNTADDVLDFAIIKEQEAHDFYMAWVGKLNTDWIKKVFKEFAQEELKHKTLLTQAKQGKTLQSSQKEITDLKIVDYLTDVVPEPDMDYQQALIVAMKREKASFKLYTDLAKIVKDDGVVTTLRALAQEEAKHKLRLETLYDDEVLTWD